MHAGIQSPNYLQSEVYSMPNFGTCFGRRRAAGIPSLEMLGVLLEAEVHLSVPLCGSYGAWEHWLECACCCRW
jgi:hypothetical protein